MRIDQGVRFGSLDELEQVMQGKDTQVGEPLEMDRIQYAAYKELIWEWLGRLNPIMVFRKHPIVVIKRSEES
jgi:hypothetical protein